MKKFFAFFIVASMLSGGYSYGQSNEKSKVSYGVKAGINVASYRLNSESRDQLKEDGSSLLPRISFHVGGYADLSVTDAFSVQAGLTLSSKGNKVRYSYDDYGFDEEISGTYTEKLLYLEVPVNAIYKAGRFYAGAGPYVGYALSGKWKDKGETDYGDGDVESFSDSDKIEFGGDEGYKRIDFGVNVLAGYQLKSKISIGVGYGLGLSNMLNRDDNSWFSKNRVFSLSVGYSF
ncbi:MAG: PorT family protein [Chitinophagaceae bacterium]|nr:PorT family protein [Chitinophagaceae bacterium]